MITRSGGHGSYDISLSCTPAGGTTTTTTIPQDCSSFANACSMDCGNSLNGRSTSGKNYFKLNVPLTSNVTVKVSPTASADYDLYVKWKKEEPTESNYDCKSIKTTGIEEECNENSLVNGTYYAMVKLDRGSGTYNISLICDSGVSTTTTTTTIGNTTTTESETTTTQETEGTTTTTPECGSNGYCEENENCRSGYKPCSGYNGDCGDDKKCCCPSEVPPGHGFNYELVVGLFLAFVLIVLVYFYLKSKSTITYEKLYKKWSRILVV
jgi:hypothetical protein